MLAGCGASRHWQGRCGWANKYGRGDALQHLAPSQPGLRSCGYKLVDPRSPGATGGPCCRGRVRRLLMHQAAGVAETGMSVSVSYDPTPDTPLGLTARVSPAWGGDARSGAEALWGQDTMGGFGMGGSRLIGSGGTRLDTEVGNGLPVGSRFVGTPRVGAPVVRARPRLPHRVRNAGPRGRPAPTAARYRSRTGGSAPSSGYWATPAAAEPTSGSSDKPAWSGSDQRTAAVTEMGRPGHGGRPDSRGSRTGSTDSRSGSAPSRSVWARWTRGC